MDAVPLVPYAFVSLQSELFIFYIGESSAVVLNGVAAFFILLTLGTLIIRFSKSKTLIVSPQNPEIRSPVKNAHFSAASANNIYRLCFRKCCRPKIQNCAPAIAEREHTAEVRIQMKFQFEIILSNVVESL